MSPDYIVIFLRITVGLMFLNVAILNILWRLIDMKLTTALQIRHRDGFPFEKKVGRFIVFKKFPFWSHEYLESDKDEDLAEVKILKEKLRKIVRCWRFTNITFFSTLAVSITVFIILEMNVNKL